MPGLVLIEGLPGVGKTTLARTLAEQLRGRGISASWEREEADAHPVIDRELRRSAAEPDYGDRCAQRWADFAEFVEAHAEPRVHVLEGCWFQSVVRFLLEQDRPQREARAYVDESVRALQRLPTRLVYLRIPDTERYLRSGIVARKGTDVVARITDYTSKTPYARSRGIEGAEALISLYADYRHLCDALIHACAFPVLTLDASEADETETLRVVTNWLVDEHLLS